MGLPPRYQRLLGTLHARLWPTGLTRADSRCDGMKSGSEVALIATKSDFV
jgi:hypothetical protein